MDAGVTRRGRLAGRLANTANPTTGCGMQQARELLHGVNRHGGEEPRRRKVSDRWKGPTEGALSPDSSGVPRKGRVAGRSEVLPTARRGALGPDVEW